VDRLEANRGAARDLVGEKRLRTWLIYMAGSAHAFSRGWISIYQLLGIKMQPDGAAPYPSTREHVYRG
jgi:cyclopropane-fatty-acyl-phospholipid synthase